uniref:Putative LAGLIDADG homing endonuclease n=1 Tax=Rhexinema sarcinoideum TaxID=43261 RepID=A0A1B2RYW7_9CHLO|nr:putative LAGLIDADG homing endonuclease [Rhexinema sarcinoideum]
MKEKKLFINIHAPKALKPQTKEAFGYFLAGLIDGSGHISKAGYVQVDFHAYDISVAYYLKKMIGSGKVSQEKKRLSVRYRCTSIAGLVCISDLLRHKLKHLDKIDQYNTRLVPLLKKQCVSNQNINTSPTVYKLTNLLENHWLAGFIQGDGCLAIIQTKLSTSRFLSSRLFISISQKSSTLLNLIQKFFGGCVGYRKDQNTYIYTSSSFTNAAKLFCYLDKYQLMGNKLTQYWIWRKAYIIVQKKQHDTASGEAKIALLKTKLAQLRKAKLEKLSGEDFKYRLQAKEKRELLRKLKKAETCKA